MDPQTSQHVPPHVPTHDSTFVPDLAAYRWLLRRLFGDDPTPPPPPFFDPPTPPMPPPARSPRPSAPDTKEAASHLNMAAHHVWQAAEALADWGIVS